MSTVTTTICDECGETCGHHYHLVIRWHGGGPIDQAEVDLCWTCYVNMTGSAEKWRRAPDFKPLLPPAIEWSKP